MSKEPIDVAEESPPEKGSLLSKLKLVGLLVLLVLVVIVILQNTESVETRILFMELKMPRAMLLFLSFLIGTATGVLLAYLRPWRKAKD